MTSLFRYPKTKHIRSVVPPKYKRYRSFKRALRLEFGRLCVYCRWPDTAVPNGHWAYAVEHYRPKKDGAGFERLICEYTNLFYACATCNAMKGEEWWQPDFVPNPCDAVMFDHLQFVNGEVRSKTKAGANAVELLRLNETNSVQYRRKAAQAAEVQFAFLKAQDQILKRVSKAPAKHPARQALNEMINAARARRELALEILLDHCGTVDARNEYLASMGYRDPL